MTTTRKEKKIYKISIDRIVRESKEDLVRQIISDISDFDLEDEVGTRYWYKDFHEKTYEYLNKLVVKLESKTDE